MIRIGEHEPLQSWVEEDDLQQEMALLRLLGKTPRRDITLRNMMNKQRDLLFDDFVPAGAVVPWFVPQPSFGSIQKLIEWAGTQSQSVAEKIYWFLEDPDTRLADTVAFLLEEDLIEPPIKPTRPTFSSLIQRVLDEYGFISMDHACDLARRELGGERPEAAARQLLRRWIREGKIILIGENTYGKPD